MKRILSLLMAFFVLLRAFSIVPAQAVGAAAAVVMEAESGVLLFAQNADKRLPMASTTKIMTALLTLEAENLDLPFVVDDAAIRVEGSSMGLTTGDTVTLRALAGGMLTASGNDAANAAAVRVAGGLPAFVAMMNSRAAALGMGNTHFANPSGLDAKEHYSTATDLAKLTRAALQNPAFAEMCAARRLTLHFGNPPYDRSLLNHNRLLSLYPPAIGVKTGFTREAGRCLVSAARKGDVTLIAVTLGCGDDWNVHQQLYEQHFPLVQRVAIAPIQGLTLPVVGGVKDFVPVQQQGAFSYSQPKGTPRQVKQTIFAPQFAYSPIKKGDILGKIVYDIDNEYLGEAMLTATEDILTAPPAKRPWWRHLKQKLDDWFLETTG